MMIIGCDLHTRYQQIAMVDTDTGELVERRLEHESGEARGFYAGLKGAVRVGIEATGHTAWFEAMLGELGHELWMGDVAKIRAAVVRKQKTDARDAAHLLDMLCTNRFPTIWRPSLPERDLRQLLWHRQKLVWMWGAVKNQMHALAMGASAPRVPLAREQADEQKDYCNKCANDRCEEHSWTAKFTLMRQTLSCLTEVSLH
jgi:transposase